MKKISAVLIDDLQDALDLLKSDLKAHCPEVEILGEAKSVIEGAKLIRNTKPDLLFLDIRLGENTGFDLLEILPDLSSRVIFVTAYDEYALKAFRFSAVDYLLKPIDPELLTKAVSKAKSQITQSQETLELLKTQIKNPEALASKVSLPTMERLHIVDIESITRCQSFDNNTQFFLESGEKIFVTRTLKKFDELFSEHSFMRVHQSHLVNLKYVRAFEKRDGGYLVMKNGENVPVSVRKKPEVVKALENYRG
ncbi:MAG: response regulator transcription factor [Saprospiraceae bacterium]|nr:response regulator transcription factor [Saprospiraceae bacterium]